MVLGNCEISVSSPCTNDAHMIANEIAKFSLIDILFSGINSNNFIFSPSLEIRGKQISYVWGKFL